MADTWYIDYSAGALTGPAVLNAVIGPQGERATGALRYIDDITNPSLVRKKHVTKSEYQSLLAAGVEMPAMFMEVSTTDPNGGYAQGQNYARRALAGADYLGYGGKILMCCDGWMDSVGVTVREWQDYLDGARSVLGDRAGGYGFADAADAARGHVTSFVQCGGRSAVRPWVNGWQDNNVQPFIGSIQTDRILLLNRFSGAGGGSAPVAPPKKGVPDMDKAELYPTKNGSVVLDVDPEADELIIQVPWVSLYVSKVAFFGRSPAQGVAWRWTYSPPQPFRVDPDRPWSVGDDGKGNNAVSLSRAMGETVGVEINWSLANPVDDKGGVVREVRGKAALHRKTA